MVSLVYVVVICEPVSAMLDGLVVISRHVCSILCGSGLVGLEVGSDKNDMDGISCVLVQKIKWWEWGVVTWKRLLIWIQRTSSVSVSSNMGGTGIFNARN